MLDKWGRSSAITDLSPTRFSCIDVNGAFRRSRQSDIISQIEKRTRRGPRSSVEIGLISDEMAFSSSTHLSRRG